jgi:hypothetical protein
MLSFRKEFDGSCQKIFENDSKIGLLCSIAPDGYPHVALISSISVKDSKTMMWGQFSKGLSKDYLLDNPKTGFMVLLPDMRWWTGKALYKGSDVKGDDLVYFNNKPLFRYNSYFGFQAVHYEELVDISAEEKLPLLKIACGFFASKALKKKLESNNSAEKIEKIPPYGLKLASALAGLKFVAFEDSDGFPRIYPVLQGQPVDSERLVFSPVPYGDMLREIPANAKAAVFLANMDLESLLIQGRWTNTIKNGKLKYSCFEADKVYNSMLPVSGYIYPPKTLPNVYGG